MKIRVYTTSTMSIRALEQALPERIAAARRVIGRAVAERLAQEVKDRIPARGGWYKIYRDALTFRESAVGNEWAVLGLSPVDLRTPPVNETLIAFGGTSPEGSILKPYNPWTIDMVPPIVGGYRDAVLVRAASESSVLQQRDRLAPLLPTVVDALDTAGFRVLDDSNLLTIGGQVMADIAYLAARLEVGYPGFPRVPHWGPVVAKARSSVESWVTATDVVSRVDQALAGAAVPVVNEMGPTEADVFRELREATWL